MAENSEQDAEAWQQDVEFLVHTLKESFDSAEARYSHDELNDTLFIELEGLEDYSEEEIIEIAEPILEVTELNVEDIILIPLSTAS
ncbi:MAG: hypothetical protein ACNA78_06295 [Balneolaceae bacterium]